MKEKESERGRKGRREGGKKREGKAERERKRLVSKLGVLTALQ